MLGAINLIAKSGITWKTVAKVSALVGAGAAGALAVDKYIMPKIKQKRQNEEFEKKVRGTIDGYLNKIFEKTEQSQPAVVTTEAQNAANLRAMQEAFNAGVEAANKQKASIKNTASPQVNN